MTFKKGDYIKYKSNLYSDGWFILKILDMEGRERKSYYNKFFRYVEIIYKNDIEGENHNFWKTVNAVGTKTDWEIRQYDNKRILYVYKDEDELLADLI